MELRSSRAFIGALAFTAGVVGGFVEVFVQCWNGPGRSKAHYPIQRELSGHTKGQVAQKWGPPPAAAMQGPVANGSTYWVADTWYYPLDSRRRTAVAVVFSEDRVVGVERIRVTPVRFN
jgi:hypothetical protein